MEPYELTITEADSLLAEKKLSSVELTRSCLARIERTEEAVCSFISLDPDLALEAAAQADNRRQRGEGGPLCGIPLSIKDLLCTKDRTTTCGSKILENFAPPYDATVVEKLSNEGAVLVGKAAMAVHLGGPLPRWLPVRCLALWGPTPVAPSGSRPRCAALSG